MIVSNSRSYIFVHIMKAAGTSVTSTLDQTLSWSDVIVGGTKYGEQIQWPYMERFGLHKHSRAREIKQVVGDDVWNEYYTFAFVRNPYTRAISLYTFIEKMIKSQGIKRHFRFITTKRKKDTDIWSWPGTIAYLESKNFSEFIRNSHFMEAPGAEPQVNWVKDENGKTIYELMNEAELLNDNEFKVQLKSAIRALSVSIRNYKDYIEISNELNDDIKEYLNSRVN